MNERTIRIESKRSQAENSTIQPTYRPTNNSYMNIKTDDYNAGYAVL